MNKLAKYLGDERQVGTYVEYLYNQSSRKQLHEWCKENQIPHPLDATKYHTTVLYSRTLLPINGQVEHVKFNFIPTEFRLFDSRGPDKDRALALILLAPQAQSVHIQLRAAGGTHDYDDYFPHVTLSYKCPESFDLSKITVPTFPMITECMRAVDLDLNWKDGK